MDTPSNLFLSQSHRLKSQWLWLTSNTYHPNPNCISSLYLTLLCKMAVVSPYNKIYILAFA